MKTYIKYIAILTIFLNVSCEDDLLDKEPLDLITDATVWNDESLIDGFLASQYTLTSVMVQESPAWIGSWAQGYPLGGFDIYNTEHGYGPLIINNFADEGKGGGQHSG